MDITLTYFIRSELFYNRIHFNLSVNMFTYIPGTMSMEAAFPTFLVLTLPLSIQSLACQLLPTFTHSINSLSLHTLSFNPAFKYCTIQESFQHIQSLACQLSPAFTHSTDPLPLHTLSFNPLPANTHPLYDLIHFPFILSPSNTIQVILIHSYMSTPCQSIVPHFTYSATPHSTPFAFTLIKLSYTSS